MTATSLDNYANKLDSTIPNSHDTIEVKKQVICDHRVKSKVLVVHALEYYTDGINKK